MPTSFTVATHPAEQVKYLSSLSSPEDVLNGSWGRKEKTVTCGELLQSSFSKEGISSLAPSDNGFVRTVMEAYNQHHHLVLRPDDVWIAILSQFNFYVNAHAEELRSQFVEHDGQKDLLVETSNPEELARQMAEEIHKNVSDPELKDWILPNFSTTTGDDTVTCAIMMMATMKAYFTYTMTMSCGIPSVTLEGEKADWEKLLSRLDKLPTFGPEPAAWAELLHPILRRFVLAFDGEPDVDFWGRVCKHQWGGSGPGRLSGWITAFCMWSSKGRWQGPPLLNDAAPGRSRYDSDNLVLDGVTYPTISEDSVTVGFGEVDVKLRDDLEEYDCLMVSGHVARAVEGNRDTVRPAPGWFMFTKGPPKDLGTLSMWGV